MKFARFLQILCLNKADSVSRKEFFVIDLFKTTGYGFDYDESYAKKLANPGKGGKPLNDSIRSVYNKPFPIENMINYLKKSLNKNRLLDLYDCFEIDSVIKQDWSVLAEAIALQFVHYMEQGESPNSSVKSIYELLIDKYGNGSIPQANEKALLAAKEALYSALSHIATLAKKPQSVLEYKGPFENYFADINKVFRVFESKCNIEGLKLFREIRDEILFADLEEQHNFDINKYLTLITTPGSLPIDLEKHIFLVIYDNLAPIDKATEVTIDIYEDFEEEKIIEAIDKAKPHNYNEYHFTEYISFSLKGEERNLLDDALYILCRTKIILNILETKFDSIPEINKINEKINNLAESIQFTEIIFISDGMYYPKTKTRVVAPSIENYLCEKDGTRIAPGDTKDTDLSKNPIYKGLNVKDLEDTLWRFYWHQLFMWEYTNFSDLMCEVITINEDGSTRYYMFPVTCKAKVYRMIRKMFLRVIGDNTIGFVAQNIMVFNKITEETMNMTSDQRSEIGETLLCCFGYMGGKHDTLMCNIEQAKKKEYTMETNYIDHTFIPLINMIRANVEGRKKLEEDKKKGLK